jgi:hypothetical protein
MKKLSAIFLTLVLVVPGTAFALDCPAGQAPTASMDSSGNITYTCQNTSSNGVYNGGTINAKSPMTLTYTPLEPLSPNDTNGYGSIQQYLQSAFTILISLGGLFAVTMLTLSGVRYMLSESFTDKDKAKTRIIASLWGLLLLASSWLILHTINPQLLQFNLTGVGIGGTGNYSPLPNTSTTGSTGGGTPLSTQQNQAVQASLNAQTGPQTAEVLFSDVVDPNNSAAVTAINNQCNSAANQLNNTDWSSVKSACATGAGGGAAVGVVAGGGILSLITTPTGAALGCIVGGVTAYYVTAPSVKIVSGDTVGLPGQTVMSCTSYTF